MKSIHAELEVVIFIKEQQVASSKAGVPSLGEMSNGMGEQTWKADTEALIVQVVMEGWYKELTEVVHKLTFELA